MRILLLLATYLMPVGAMASEQIIDRGEQSYILSLLDDVAIVLMKLWNYKLFTMDNQSVAISNILIAIVSLIIGLKIARRVSSWLKHKLLKKIHLDETITDALTKLFHYIFVIILTLIALDIAHVPLTVFTFIGGAIAISIGVGGQHLFNNFISGLVLLMENPIKIGDLIEVEGIIGKVKSLNARCVNIRTASNMDVLVPHSTLLQSNVINWTQGNSLVRLEISLQIARDKVEFAKVEKILKDSVSESEHILPYHEPEVILSKLKYNTYVVNVRFWIDLSTINDRIKMMSDLNVQIDKALKKHKINLAISTSRIYESNT
jgi:potassium-dependent mechanosensitive channel